MTLASSRKKRGVVRASLTTLGKKLADLEKDPSPWKLDHAHRMLSKLDSLNSEFKVHHYSVVEFIEKDEELEKEQTVLDQHDDVVTDLSIRLEKLIAVLKSASTSPTSPSNLQLRKLHRLEQELSSIRDSVGSMDTDTDNTCKLQMHQDQLSELKRELVSIRDALLSMGVADTDGLMVRHDRLEGKLFDQSLCIRELLRKQCNTAPLLSTEHKVAKLPKLSVPTFSGDVLGWQTFWEQFNVAVHESTHISDAEKLVYLRQALKDGSAKNVIEGLSRSGEQYKEAVECLCARYDRPRLIHQAHVRKILEVPNLKEGSGKELRKFHDTMQQHVRALKTMGHEPPGSFLTSLMELKLDSDTAFEWQKHSQSTLDIPPYQDLLKFVDLRAQASETSSHDSVKRSTYNGPKPFKKAPPFNAFVADVNPQQCVVCKDKHPLYSCMKFKAMSHDEMLSTVRENRLCMNCFSGDHFVKNCKSNHRCKRCQKPHHTILHVDDRGNQQSSASNNSADSGTNPITSHTSTGLNVDTLMMTCRVLISNNDGSSVEARALLDSASSASFVSERLAQALHLPRSKHGATITGIAGLSHGSPTQSVTTLALSAVKPSSPKIGVKAIIIPQVTCELPHHPINLDSTWNHLSDIDLADPYFGQPGKIDVLLGVDIFVQVVRDGRRVGPPGSPVAFETVFGWVLAGEVKPSVSCYHITSCHVALESGDDLLRRFWEIEQQPIGEPIRSPEEKSVVQHFQDTHFRDNDGRFIVPLPRRANVGALGESRSQAVRRFNNLERSLHSKSQFAEVDAVIQEYLELDHAEPVPEVDLHKPVSEVYYMPIHVVRKETSSTTKVRAVFDASAKSSSGVSLNETFLVGPTVHPPLIDVLLRFRSHRVALTTDVSKMYRAVGLIAADKDLHRFVWRSSQTETLRDYRMTRVTFGVSASSFAVNMSLLQNANELAHEFPLAAKAVLESFYVDDGLTGADSVPQALALRSELQELFARGQFLLRKWRSNSSEVLSHIAPELRESQVSDPLAFSEEYSKTLGLEWNSQLDVFRITVSELPSIGALTKRALVSDVARIFDVLGWYAPTIIKMKILLQKVWESRVEWDDLVPEPIQEIWSHWRSQLPVLAHHHIPRCYFPLDFDTTSVQLHGFSDASEDAYAGVVYLRFTDSNGSVHLSLVVAKTKVSPIKRLTIPRLELCGALLLSKLLCHAQSVLSIPLPSVFGWTDSTIVLHWMSGDPRRLKTYVGNRISSIVDRIPPERWKHVRGTENPADCASRGLFPQELKEHSLWWDGPPWLQLSPDQWPPQPSCFPCEVNNETKNVSMHVAVEPHPPIIPYDHTSSFSHLKRVTAWVLRFVCACQKKRQDTFVLTVEELASAEAYWISMIQMEHFSREMRELKAMKAVSSTSSLLALRPYLDSHGLLRVGGRRQLSKASPSQIHPVILHKKHPLTRLIVRAEHIRLLHAGPTLTLSSLRQRYHVVGGRQLVRLVCRECVTCRRTSVRPVPQLLGQLPPERVTPGPVFNKVGVDYAGPINIKYGYVRRPVVVKAYICVFVSLTVKAVHLEVSSDLTTDAFLAALRRFIARRGKPALIWSDNGSNFVGADNEIKNLYKFLRLQKTDSTVSEFCSSQGIEWKFIPQHSPHFGGLWEAAVKSTKRHLKRVVSDVKLTFEEISTVLAQIEAVLNSRPLAPLPGPDEALEPLTPGHFLIGQPLESLPDPSASFRPFALLRRWQLCQNLVRHFWTRWSREYLINLDKINKWKVKSRNLAVGDIVVLQEDGLVPLKWQLARVVEVHPGLDGIVRVATIKTQTGTYKRPVTKLALLLSE